jgi:DNA-binding Lrp family transcriptional regulator
MGRGVGLTSPQVSVGKQRSTTNKSMAEMVKLISQIGPRVPEIARRLGRHKETVRYWYKELMKWGFEVQGSVDSASLGLHRVVIVVDFADDFKRYASSVLAAMHELCYLRSYAKTLPTGSYIVHANVPGAYVDKWIELMYSLKQKGLFTSIQSYVFDWTREVPMAAEHYDFDHGRWDFDWSSRSAGGEGANPKPKEVQSFDALDLGIMERLEVDGTTPLTEIQDDLKVNYKTLNWHYRNHITKRGLLNGYWVNWIGAKYNVEPERVTLRRQKYVWVEILVRDVSEAEQVELMSNMNALPYAWFEAGGANSVSQLAFPIESVTEAMHFIERLIAPVKSRTTWFLLDQTDALSFAINPKLYNESTKNWEFHQEELLSRFDKLTVEPKSEKT